jgi:hypothetical protein
MGITIIIACGVIMAKEGVFDHPAGFPDQSYPDDRRAPAGVDGLGADGVFAKIMTGLYKDFFMPAGLFGLSD